MSFIPKEKEEIKWLIIIAASVFLLNLFHLLVWRPFIGNSCWHFKVFVLFISLGFIFGFLTEIEAKKCFYLAFKGAFIGGAIFLLILFPSPSVILFMISQMLIFSIAVTAGKSLKENFEKSPG
ncbi:MAG: hypothetical protein U9N35_07990 [Euryarchaeota archaeon]|nr:hypothetical protein [Euryarchaeota archaeon]